MRRRSAVVLAVLVAGCSGIPAEGPVTRMGNGDVPSHGVSRYVPAKPRSGATERQIVDGYLDAMLAQPEATGIVQSYLTPAAAKSWRPEDGIVVYQRAEVRQGRIDLDQTMAISADGRATVQHRAVRLPMTLRRVAGEWRVDTPADGYLVSTRFASDHLRSYPLWFFDVRGERLVPELTHRIVGRQLVGELVQRLADGPDDGSLRTYVPSDERVRVQVKGRVAEVYLSRLPDDSSDRFRAQLLSTLRGVSGIDGVRVFIDGNPDGGVHALDAVVGFGPRSVADRVFGLEGRRIVLVSRRPRTWAPARGASAIAVDSSGVAVVRSGGRLVAVGDQTIPGTSFATPVFDDEHRLWLVDGGDGPRVRIVEAGQVRQISDAFVGRVESFAVSPDGARYAAALRDGADATVIVGEIQRDASGLVVGVGSGRPVSAGLRDERLVGWASHTRVEFVADTAYGPQLHTVGFDGADPMVPAPGRAVPQGGVKAWAGAPVDGAERWAIDGTGRLWRQRSGRMWTAVAKGPFRALVVGR